MILVIKCGTYIYVINNNIKYIYDYYKTCHLQIVI